MSVSLPPNIAVVLPPREEFGPRRARGIGLTVRHHSLATPSYRTAVFAGPQSGPVFLDVTSRLVTPRWYLPASSRMRYAFGLLRPLRLLEPKLIEVHADPLIALTLQRRFPTVPVVLVLHDDPAANRLIRAPGRRARLLGRLSGVFTISQWLRDRLLDGIGEPTRMPVVVPPGVDVANLPRTPSGTDNGGAVWTRRRTRLVLFVGRLVPEKGADRFVAACSIALASMPGWRAEIIGAAEHMTKAPETAYVKLLEATAEPASIAMMGYRDHPDVMAAMARAAIVVIPGGMNEPGGRVAVEAMASGAVVICSSRGALPEICGDAAIYVDTGDPVALAAAISALGQDPPRLAALAEAGRQRAKQFDLTTIGRILDQVRKRVIAEGPPKV